MTDQTQISIQRCPDVLKRTGLSRSTFYLRIKQGLLPPPISLGERAVGWLEHEISAVLKAITAGRSPDEVKVVVEGLVASRTSAP